ncbi:MAG: SDR family oxidoreductase [Alphaproteobacteria bacterium]|nr:SDR family oxidoreductase [Alphaproteobacteria bacterium]
MTPDFRLEGRTALVTGAGRGLGAGMAKGLSGAGARVVLMSRTRSELDALAEDIRASGGDADVLVCDATDEDAVRAAISALSSLDILVNNAGTNIPQPFVDVESAALDTMLNLNVRAAFIVAQAAVNRMLKDADRATRGGAVVNISSQLGRVALRDRSVYTMTKHAVEGLTKSMAIELAPHRIRVNAVGPTWVDTPMTGPALADPDFRAEIIGSIPMGHLAQIDDIVGAVVFLASPAAAMITGASLVVDGGWTAR